MGSLVSKHFVFMHVPKTGGTWLGNILLNTSPPEWEVRYVGTPRIHEDASALTEDQRKLPRFGFTRNPWDWYVSLYCFLDEKFRAKEGDFSLPLDQLDPLWQKWGPIVESVPEGRDGFGEALTIALGDVDFGDFDRLKSRLLSGCDGVGRFESLRKDAAMMLRSAGKLPRSLTTALEKDEAIHQSHRESAPYYTQELAYLVAGKETSCQAYLPPALRG